MISSLRIISDALPAFVFRKDISTHTQGILNPRTMANLDSQGRGISGAIVIGKRVAYPRESVIAFLAQQVRPRKNRGPSPSQK